MQLQISQSGHEYGTKLEKYFWLAILIFFGWLHYSTYMFSVIPPQTGWWQYMAQRLSSGELLYRDIFMYIPPYFVWFTTLLYEIFGANLFAFTIFGFIFFRIVPWILMYLILVRYTKPCLASWGLIVGLCMTSAYLMDQCYDYNPMIMMLCILQAYILLRAYESNSNTVFWILTFLEGIICGIHLMLKQNVGIVMPVVCLPILILLSVPRKRNGWIPALLLFVVGIIAAVLPGILYLWATGTLDEAWWCIQEALGAKLGTDSLLTVALRNFIRPKEMLIAVLLFIVYLCASQNIKGRGYLLPMVALLLGVVIFQSFGQYASALHSIFGKISIQKRLLLLSLGVAALIAMVICAMGLKKCSNFFTCLSGVFLLLFAVCRLIVPNLTVYAGEMLFYDLDWPSLKKIVVYILLYFNIGLWFENFYLGVVKGNQLAKKYVIVNTIIMAFIAVSFVSAQLEELYTLLLIPNMYYAFEKCILIDRNDVKTKRFVLVSFSAVVIGLSVLICSCSMLQKIYMPYEWHSWRTSSLSRGKNVVPVDIDGLRGFHLAEEDAQTYSDIIEKIETNSDPSDTLYQFPNIPLFNVLTNRKSLYVAIPYFDVCPDSMAQISARELAEDPPQLILWAELSEDRWNVHEQVFRGGNRSGQRDIMQFYNDVVKTQYELLGEYSNNEGERILLWKKPDE